MCADTGEQLLWDEIPSVAAKISIPAPQIMIDTVQVVVDLNLVYEKSSNQKIE